MGKIWVLAEAKDMGIKDSQSEWEESNEKTGKDRTLKSTFT